MPLLPRAGEEGIYVRNKLLGARPCYEECDSEQPVLKQQAIEVFLDVWDRIHGSHG